MPYTLFKSSLATIAFSSLSCLEAGSAVGQPFVYVGNASSATVSVIEAAFPERGDNYPDTGGC